MKKVLVILLLVALAIGLSWYLLLRGGEKSESPLPRQAIVADDMPAVPKGAKSLPASAPRALPQVAEDADPPGNLRLEGQVLDADNLPVDGATVAISSNPAQTALTERDGSFGFDSLIGKRFRLTARSGRRVAGPVFHKLSGSSEPVILRLRPGAVVEVTVRTAKDKQAVVGAQVELRSIERLEQVTDSQGRAQVTGVAAGSCTLAVKAAGYVPAHQLLLIPDTTTEPIRARVDLLSGLQVQGLVRDEAGQPVVKARVLAEDSAALISLADAKRDGALTDAEGRFVMPALAPGTFRLTAYHEDHPPAVSAAVRVEAARPTPDVQIVMKSGARLAGRVLSDDGQPHAWARVRCVRADGMPFSGGAIGGVRRRDSTADEQGAFSFQGLPRQQLLLVALAETAASESVAVNLQAQAEKEGVILRLTVTASIAGMVVDGSGQGVAEVTVTARPDFWESGLSDEIRLRGSQQTHSDGAGKFKLSGLADGVYRLQATHSAGSRRRYTLPGVQARTGDQDVRLLLENDGGLKGRVAFSDGGQPASFSVTIGYPPGIAISSPDGLFDLPAVPAGSHQVTIRGQQFADQVIEAVEIKSGQKTDLGLVTVKRGRSVNGRVLTAEGSPVPGARVLLGARLVGDGNGLSMKLGPAVEESMGLRRAQSDADGRFRIGGLGPDRLFLAAEHDQLGRSEPVALPVGGQDLHHDLVLHVFGKVVGTVTVNGKPATGVVVSANSKGEAGQTIVVHTGTDGAYVIEKLPAGGHRITASLIGTGGLGGAKSNGRIVEVRAREEISVDIEISSGNVDLTVQVAGRQDAKIDLAQVFVLKGQVRIQTAAELNKVAMSAGGSIQQTFWLPGKPAQFKEMSAGEYSLCVLPINGNMNDPAFVQNLQKQAAQLKVYCSPLLVKDSPPQQEQQVLVPPMEPLPSK